MEEWNLHGLPKCEKKSQKQAAFDILMKVCYYCSQKSGRRPIPFTTHGYFGTSNRRFLPNCPTRPAQVPACRRLRGPRIRRGPHRPLRPRGISGVVCAGPRESRPAHGTCAWPVPQRVLPAKAWTARCPAHAARQRSGPARASPGRPLPGRGRPQQLPPGSCRFGSGELCFGSGKFCRAAAGEAGTASTDPNADLEAASP